MKKMHIHGNCQSLGISKILSACLPDWQITYYEVHADPIIEQKQRYMELVTTSDIVVSQPIGRGYRGHVELESAWIKEAISSTTTLIMIPALHFTAYHGASDGFFLPGLFARDGLPAHLIAAGLSPDEMVAQLMDPDLYSDVFIEKEFALTISEMQRREKAECIDVVMSDFLQQSSVGEQLFHIVNHPSLATYLTLTERIGNILSLGIGRPNWTIDLQDSFHIPPYPAVRRYMENHTAGAVVPSHATIVGVGQLEQSDYLLRMGHELSAFAPTELRSAISAAHRVRDFLGRLAAANERIPEIDIWAPANRSR